MTLRHEALRNELDFARERTDELFRLIPPDAIYERPISERNRLIFYLGHFEAFDWNLLASRIPGEKSLRPEFDGLFERGIDPEPGHAPADTPADWPRRAEVEAYKDHAREWVDAHLEDLDPLLLQMALEHRHMHAETFAYLIHNLPYDRKKPSFAPELPNPRPAPANPMVRVNGGSVTLGKTADGFGWDNEHLAHEVSVPSFHISKYKVSNGAYLDFVNQGGSVPHFWTQQGGNWLYKGMFNEVPLPLDWPAWVTWQQADAFAKWRDLSLPTEAQFQSASRLSEPDAVRDNFGYSGWDPVPVDTANGSSSAPAQMVGNGWEWTSDVFAPFEGFQPSPLYPGYSADFFDGQHYVMKGASPRTARMLTRSTFRNWFRPEYPFMYAGFRVVENYQ